MAQRAMDSVKKPSRGRAYAPSSPRFQIRPSTAVASGSQTRSAEALAEADRKTSASNIAYERGAGHEADEVEDFRRVRRNHKMILATD